MPIVAVVPITPTDPTNPTGKNPPANAPPTIPVQVPV